MPEVKNKITNCVLVFFWLVFAIFILVTGAMFLSFIPYMGYIAGIPLMIFLSILGLVLIILAARANVTKIAKSLFILTGAAAQAMG
ncbi:MAG: hypothetical protein JW997_03600 [Actinobacteria bacterium]|nr:hypothetical protein [Actinomycetota bacterium]